jgi:hypothetical protein
VSRFGSPSRRTTRPPWVQKPDQHASSSKVLSPKSPSVPTAHIHSFVTREEDTRLLVSRPVYPTSVLFASHCLTMRRHSKTRTCNCPKCGGKPVDLIIWAAHNASPLPPRDHVSKTQAPTASRPSSSNETDSRYTERAAAILRSCIKRAHSLLEDLNRAKSHTDLDRFERHADEIRMELVSITRSAICLDPLRDEVHGTLQLFKSHIVVARERLGERSEPILCSIGECEYLS